MQRNVKARHFRRQAYPRSRREWKYPCCLYKTVETCRMVKRDEPNHHTISHTPPFFDRFCRKVGFYACPTRPLLHVAAFEGGVEGTIMVVVMYAQCRHEAVQRAHGLQPLFRRAFLRMAQYIDVHLEWETGKKVLHLKNGRCLSGALLVIPYLLGIKKQMT